MECRVRGTKYTNNYLEQIINRMKTLKDNYQDIAVDSSYHRGFNGTAFKSNLNIRFPSNNMQIDVSTLGLILEAAMYFKVLGIFNVNTSILVDLLKGLSLNIGLLQKIEATTCYYAKSNVMYQFTNQSGLNIAIRIEGNCSSDISNFLIENRWGYTMFFDIRNESISIKNKDQSQSQSQEDTREHRKLYELTERYPNIFSNPRLIDGQIPYDSHSSYR